MVRRPAPIGAHGEKSVHNEVMSAEHAEQTPATPDESLMRGAHIPANYSAGRHIASTLGIAALILIGAVALAVRARPLDWVLLPTFWFVANFIEWAFHHYPMHRPMPPRLLYKNHAQLHHLAFTEESMPVTETRELGLVMMPWYTMIGLFVIASPVFVAAAWLRGPGLAGVFLIAAVIYFVAYELLHAFYHLPPATLARLGLREGGLFYRLRAHHARHHVLRRMAHANFNVTVPLMDWLFGTRE
jgi:Fatty acid hydroxylase superfamily